MLALALFFFLVLEAVQGPERHLGGAFITERRLLVANLVAACPDEQARARGLAVETLPANVTVVLSRGSRFGTPRERRVVELDAIG
jgi:hypothetical protein